MASREWLRTVVKLSRIHEGIGSSHRDALPQEVVFLHVMHGTCSQRSIFDMFPEPLMTPMRTRNTLGPVLAHLLLPLNICCSLTVQLGDTEMYALLCGLLSLHGRINAEIFNSFSHHRLTDRLRHNWM